MYHLLLTGAGFSYNWGGFLANEAFEYLLAATEGDDDLRSTLWRDHDSHFAFEDTLARLQAEFKKKWSPQVEQNLNNLHSALQRMFGDMALAFSRVPFEPANKPISCFLGRFDAIFTLNQDTLLETHYLPHVQAATFAARPDFAPKLTAAHRPGLVQTKHSLSFGPMGSLLLSQPASETDLALTPGLQPYFKLHGSIDVRAAEREMMLILGGDKQNNIAKHPLLMFYHRQFIRMICAPGARLMIIGYSFGDPHINQMLMKGVEAGLKMFVIDPYGADALTQQVHTLRFNPGFVMKNAVVGASRRQMRRTIEGLDLVELAKIDRFFRYVPAKPPRGRPTVAQPAQPGNARRGTQPPQRKRRR